MAALNLGLGGSNPYVQNQAQALQNQSNQNLQQNVLPGIGQGAQAAGMYGSSRQGIAQGQAIGNAQTGLDSAIAGLYTNAYGQDLNAQLQRDQIASQGSIAAMNNATNMFGLKNSYDLGLRNSDYQFANLDANIANSNFGNQLSAANFGLNAFNSQQAANNQAIQAGTQIKNTPYDYWNSFNTAANNVGNGLASTTQSQTATGNPWLGALGGWQLGSKIGG